MNKSDFVSLIEMELLELEDSMEPAAALKIDILRRILRHVGASKPRPSLALAWVRPTPKFDLGHKLGKAS